LSDDFVSYEDTRIARRSWLSLHQRSFQHRPKPKDELGQNDIVPEATYDKIKGLHRHRQRHLAHRDADLRHQPGVAHGDG
jgi:hypothetical protein